MMEEIYGENFKPNKMENKIRQASLNKKKPFYESGFFWIILFIVIGSIISINNSSKTHDSSNDSNSPNTSDSYQQGNNESYKSLDQSRSGTYYDYDRSTGWETTVTVSGNTFYGKTIIPTGEIIASGSGTVNGNNLIDEYGQNVGSVGSSSLSITVGGATIYCNKK